MPCMACLIRHPQSLGLRYMIIFSKNLHPDVAPYIFSFQLHGLDFAKLVRLIQRKYWFRSTLLTIDKMIKAQGYSLTLDIFRRALSRADMSIDDIQCSGRSLLHRILCLKKEAFEGGAAYNFKLLEVVKLVLEIDKDKERETFNYAGYRNKVLDAVISCCR